MSENEVQLGCTIKTQHVIHTTAFGFVFMSLSLNIVSIFGASWLHFDGSTKRFPDNHVYFGVTRNCWKTTDGGYCKYRDDLFRFKYLTSKEGRSKLPYKFHFGKIVDAFGTTEQIKKLKVSISLAINILFLSIFFFLIFNLNYSFKSSYQQIF